MHDQGITLRQAAVIAGVGILIMVITAPFAEVVVFPKLLVPGDIEETTRNIRENRGLFLAGVFAFLITLMCDVLVAWALYVLLIPVNRSLSLLTAWFRLFYAVIALSGLLKLGSVFRMLRTPDYLAVVGSEELHAQVQLLVKSYGHEWDLGFVPFGIHLVLLGYLVYRSGYIPRILGILLAIAGVGYPVYYLKPYLYPNADLEFILVIFVAELFFMLWLLIRGWKIQDPTARPDPAPGRI